ncbi:MAG: OmpH family outer membrane protein [Verrucomicrobia bacterium]|nr:OmpH family outer membrane protein [Verrucomicrobiota bacterium]
MTTHNPLSAPPSVIARWLLALLSVTLAAHAQPKIAVIDLPKVFNLYYKTVRADAALKERGAEFEKAKQEMIDRYHQAEAEYRRLVAEAGDPALSAQEQVKRKSQAEAKLRDLKEMDERFAKFVRDTQEAVANQIQRLREKHLREIQENVSAKSNAEGYELVLNTSALGADHLPLVVFHHEVPDLTDAIVQQLNANAPAEPNDKKSTQP